ncbi:hypothetical protein NDK47_12905 [Brevibacillus ruminantium]|uniref:Uncharacterized protein n=1 Tax=Brevibacillus ruminantium TaxID=2950604 RepID=A0ABY4WM09_9BACL|nr:hypothetical protein [Brevibacillus ruminantium]USG68122.1 hypothetical protein NDK47_12905 [Brevibacillus ruminantium]
MTESIQDAQPITLSTQAFLILCRMLDGFYDDLRKHEQVGEMVESIADILLAGVQKLEEQVQKPKKVTLPLTLPQAFFLRRLVSELIARAPQDQDSKTAEWLQECLAALSGGGDQHAASLS